MKDSAKLYRILGLPSRGRLQPSVWLECVTQRQGMLQQAGLLSQARSHLKVSRDLKAEGWREVMSQGGSETDEVLYGYVKCDNTKCGNSFMLETAPSAPNVTLQEA